MAKSPSDVLKMAKEAGVKIVDFRFVDLLRYLATQLQQHRRCR